MFAKASDETLIHQMHLQFAIITGAEAPKKKHAGGKADVIPFSQLSFLNIMAFVHAFREAQKRGLLHPVEIAMGEEILAIVGA